jgi:hypothetical protein
MRKIGINDALGSLLNFTSDTIGQTADDMDNEEEGKRVSNNDYF